MKNENHNKVSSKVGSKVSSKISTKLSNNQVRILNLIQENPHISRNELSKKIGLSETSIYNNIQELKAQGYIERVGADKNGYWKILK